MSHAQHFWSIWQALLAPFAAAFTRPGHRRFVEWVTALALAVEEHTITGSVTALDRLADGEGDGTVRRVRGLGRRRRDRGPRPTRRPGPGTTLARLPGRGR